MKYSIKAHTDNQGAGFTTIVSLLSLPPQTFSLFEALTQKVYLPAGSLL